MSKKLSKKRWFVTSFVVLLTILASWPDPPEVHENPQVVFRGQHRATFGPLWRYADYCLIQPPSHAGQDFGSPIWGDEHARVGGFSTRLLAVDIIDACRTDGSVIKNATILSRVGWRPSNSRLPEFGTYVMGWDHRMIGLLEWTGFRPFFALDIWPSLGKSYLSWSASPWCNQDDPLSCRRDLR